NIEFHPAQQIHQLHKALDVNDDMVVDWNTQQIGYAILQLLNSFIVQGIDSQGTGVHQGVPGDGHQADSLVDGVVGENHDGVRIAADLIRGHQKEGVAVRLPLVGAADLL